MKTVFSENQEIEAIPVGRLIVGRIYVFIFNEELTIHRLLRITNDSLIFKGDMSLCLETVKPEAILGEVPSKYNFLYLALSPYNQINRSRLLRILSRFLMNRFSGVLQQPK